METELKILSSDDVNDFVDLIKLFGNVFEIDHLKIPNDKHLESLLQNQDFLVLIAKSSGRVVGGLTVHILHGYYSTKPIAYIYDVGVRQDYQRNGIGKKLIAYLTNYCRENNFVEAYVEAETDDIPAISFYRSTRVNNELQATHFTYFFDNSREA